MPKVAFGLAGTVNHHMNHCTPRFFRCMSVLRLPVLLLFATLVGAVVGQGQEMSQYEIPETDEGLPGDGPIRRYDWFRDLWKERRSEWSRTAERDQGAVVFVGDSITQGWGGGFAAAFHGVKVANRGISGDTTRGVLIRLEEDVLNLNPRAVVILIGTNDLDEGASPEVIASNLSLIIETLKEHRSDLPILLCEVFPSSASKNRPVEQIQEINERYREAVKGDPNVIVLDTWELFANEDGDAIAAEFPDLLHPNEIGYAKWAAALRPIFATLGYIETDIHFVMEDGYESLFNGVDLSGWGYRPTSEADRESARRWQEADPEGAATWPFVDTAVSFDGLTESPDGRFAAINGRLVVKAPAEYRKIQQLWSTRSFPGDFILKLEFRATPYADSGVYLRGPQLQCRDYSLAGPYQGLRNYKPQDWNELVVTVQDGVARAECNGEVLEEQLELPPTGPIGVEGDRGQMEFRRIRILEL